MTKPVQTRPQNHPGVNSQPVVRQRPAQKPLPSVKKAPAPPPNPALVNPPATLPPAHPTPQSHQSASESALSAEVKPLQITQETQSSYVKHSDGALTYFNYYFEDIAAQSKAADYPAPFSRSRFPVGAVGVGVVAATITSGLMIGNALKPSEVPLNSQSPDSTDKQDASAQSPRPTTIAPEKLETGRSLSSTPTWSPLTKPTPVKPSTTPLKRSQSATNSLITSGPLVSNSQPLKLPPVSVSAVSSGGANALLPASASPAASATPPSLASEMVARAANLPAMSAPESPAQAASLPSPASVAPFVSTNSNPVAVPGAAATPINQGSSPASAQTLPANLPAPGIANSGNTSANTTTPFPPGSPGSISAPDSSTLAPTANLSTASQVGSAEAGSPLVQPSNPPAIAPSTSPSPIGQQSSSTQPVMAPGDRLLEAGSPGLNRLAPTSLTPMSTSSAQEGIQDYLNRPQQPATQPQTLLPLSSKAAGEAASKPQIGTFAVRQVNQQEYQKEWLASNRNPSDPAIAYAFPAYGFIDYQRQVIIVLKEQPDTTPLQSKAPNLPNG